MNSDHHLWSLETPIAEDHKESDRSKSTGCRVMTSDVMIPKTELLQQLLSHSGKNAVNQITDI